MRTSLAELIRTEDSRTKARQDAERKQLDEAVRARVLAEEHARNVDRMREEAERVVYEQRARAAREEGARMEAVQHESVVALRERLARDLDAVEKLRSESLLRERSLKAQRRGASLFAGFALVVAATTLAFAFVVRESPSTALALRASEADARVNRQRADRIEGEWRDLKEKNEALVARVRELREAAASAARAPAQASPASSKTGVHVQAIGMGPRLPPPSCLNSRDPLCGL